MSTKKHSVPPKFVEFLDGERGRAQELADFFEVHKNRISRMKKGLIPMPREWVSPIASFAKSRGFRMSPLDLLGV